MCLLCQELSCTLCRRESKCQRAPDAAGGERGCCNSGKAVWLILLYLLCLGHTFSPAPTCPGFASRYTYVRHGRTSPPPRHIPSELVLAGLGNVGDALPPPSSRHVPTCYRHDTRARATRTAAICIESFHLGQAEKQAGSGSRAAELGGGGPQ